jgi:hypothetical protein
MLTIPPQSRRFSPELFWVVGRLLVFLIVVLCLVAFPSLHKPIMDILEPVFDIWQITVFVIWRASTPLTRLLLAIETAVVFLLILKVGQKIGGWKGYFAALATAGAVSFFESGETWGQPLVAFVVMCLLASNCAPMSLLTRLGLKNSQLNRLILIAPVIAEVFFAGRYISWIRAKLHGKKARHAEEARKLPGAILAALVFATFCPPKNLFDAERLMRGSADVRMFARGDFNGLAYDAADNRLFATGHGTLTLLSYDASNLKAAPKAAWEPSDGAQSLDFDAERDEIYVFSEPRRVVQVFVAKTLALIKTIPAPNVSQGDAWVAHEPITNTVIVSSEADEQFGRPLLVLDRATHAVVDSRGEEAGNILVRPDAPIVYMSFYRRGNGVFAYDLQKKAVVARARTSSPMDRMAWDSKRRELLVTSPAEDLIYRFDPNTLKLKGTFAGIFGVRAIAVDEKNDVILLGSLASGKLALMGLSDHKIKRSWYLGPWLRSIVIVPGRGIAYVSSQTALYEVRYLKPAS